MRLLDEILIEMSIEDGEGSIDSESSMIRQLESAIRSLKPEQRKLVLQFADYIGQSGNAANILKDISDKRNEISESVKMAESALEFLKESDESIVPPDENEMDSEAPQEESRAKKIWKGIGSGLRGFFRYIGKGLAWIATHPITIAKLVLIAFIAYKCYLLYGDITGVINRIKSIGQGWTQKMEQQTKDSGQEWLDAHEKWKAAGMAKEPNGFFGKEEEISPTVRHRIGGLSGSLKPYVRPKGPRHH